MIESKETIVRWLMSVGIVIFVFIIVYASFTRESFSDNRYKTLKEFTQLSHAQRHSIVEDYVSIQHINQNKMDAFYACVSEHAFTKNPNTELGYIAKLCKKDYENNLLSRYVSFDNFEKGFNKDNGSYEELNNILKNRIGNTHSYQPITTSYRFVTYGTTMPKAIVKTRFSEKNSSGKIVKRDATASVDVSTGKVLRVISVL
ncbi:hypothetical protein [Vibrio marisflavi]|uniref:Uncharacterized protein n=1 Tax=Vibrio marisflavi CECT 7928 TaxID=634439 RepID=A0ABM9A4N0_9VIBR|nr:hypothetical protein [Vibrio marisflavi]CAH0539790.1 hypothetical protein VMF7928_02447 [Vibrio marisflavi CECT 7928]